MMVEVDIYQTFHSKDVKSNYGSTMGLLLFLGGDFNP
jgi:hypothetical protein